MASKEELEGWILDVALRADRQAFAGLFKHYAPRIKSFMLRGGCAPEQAEEIAQETLVTLWHKARQFDAGRASLSTWIFTIARHQRIDLHRRRASAVDTVELDAEHVPEAADEASGRPDELLGTGQRSRRVRSALAQLPDEQALVLRLSFFEDQPHAEIARTLALPLGTVKSRIRLAVGQLRRLLGELE
ncbi:MAG TPA: sigma-70 family RNA polymerase sigma factor [Burkholderiaceae bacterium]|jgi:RNA polymerase sigma-70 factor (ECF subfamily)|nr:sigma-70 family RNA polymerase sigma factor [Burkholderiaceae bacterium]